MRELKVCPKKPSAPECLLFSEVLHPSLFFGAGWSFSLIKVLGAHKNRLMPTEKEVPIRSSQNNHLSGLFSVFEWASK